MPLASHTRLLSVVTSVACTLMLLTACLPELGENQVITDPRDDYDQDGFTELDGDCDDANPDANPDSIWWADADNDGYGNPSLSTKDCLQPAGTVAGAIVDGLADTSLADCDDTNALINPAAEEICDGLDNNCDALIDPEGTSGQATFYLDVDGDGFGSGEATLVGCDGDTPAGYVPGIDRDGDGEIDADCDDFEAARFPGNPEICDGLDNDCDGLADDADDDVALDAVTWWRDEDFDHFGGDDPSLTLVQCSDPTIISSYHYTLTNTDCNDADDTINPGVLEVCDGFDKNCDGIADDDLKQTYYADLDGDTYGDPATATAACSLPADHSQRAEDCDDTNADVNPSKIELCNGLDDNCDSLTDGADAADAQPYFPDVDQDGYGDSGATAQYACEAPYSFVANALDCADQRADANPAASETCATDYDDDCDGDTNDENATGCVTYYADADADGYGGNTSECRCEATGSMDQLIGGDCDDTSDAIRPNVVETCATAVDDNCDGSNNDENAIGCTLYYFDNDGDGYGDDSISRCTCNDGGSDAWVLIAGDCDDTTTAISPSADELCTPDGATPIDEDCDGQLDEASAANALTFYADTDEDGYGDASAPIRACSQPADAVVDASDCDDNRKKVNPGKVEDCSTGFDDDCNGDTNDHDALNCTWRYPDADTDGFGDSNSAGACVCDATLDFEVEDNSDCDDAVDAIYPGQSESCATAIDDDCSGSTNDEDAIGCTEYFNDQDGDAYGVGILGVDSRCL